MLRVSLGAIILGLSAMPISSDANCDMAYGAFMVRLSHWGGHPSLARN